VNAAESARQTLEARCLALIVQLQHDHGDAGLLALGIVPGANLSFALLKRYQAFAQAACHARRPEFSEDGVRLIHDFFCDLENQVTTARRQLAEPALALRGRYAGGAASVRAKPSGAKGRSSRRNKTIKRGRR